MGHMLHNREPEVQRAAARLMSDIDEKLKAADRLEERIELSKRLAEWIQVETDPTPEYEEITERPGTLSKTPIENERPGDAAHILTVYHRIYSGGLKKKEELQVLAAKLLQNLATEDILNLLLKLKRTSSDGTRRAVEDDGSVLAILGGRVIERLRDLLHKP